MKMIDKYAAEIINSELFGPSVAAGLKERMTVVDITNVAHWFYVDNPKEDWDYTEDFPNIVCPWDVAFFEWQTPSHSNNEGKLTKLERDVRRWGASIGTISIKEDRGRKVLEVDPLITAITNLAPGRIQGLDPGKYATPIDDLPPVKWMTTMNVFTERANGSCAMFGAVFDFLDDNGKPLIDARRVLSPHKDRAELVPSVLMPVYFAISLLHCKNVATTDHHVPPKVAAKRIRNGKPPGVTYKTLEIGPMKQILKTKGKSDEVGLKKALHICRGHFATYTPERPLFGKITGTFWRPMHVRGSKAHGEIKKDYKINP